jgi:acetyltransferase-like isoleucine patch superfamily enzyme
MPRIHFIAESADVSPDAVVGEGARIWHYAQVRERATIGPGCIVGRGAYVDTGVTVGANCKIQNHALVYAPARLEDGVFIGPGAVLTNDRHPRAVNPDGTSKVAEDWNPAGVHIERGASIGAMAVVVAGVRIGAWALVGAGAVVTRDVPSFAVVVGNPARRVAWVGRSGRPLEVIDGNISDPITGVRYQEVEGVLEELS